MTAEATPHYAAIVTPFYEHGAINEAGLRKLCEHLVDIPSITGLVANANAAEVDALTQDERRQTLRIAVEVAHSAGKEVVAGLAPIPSSFAGAVENARQFADDGADSLLLLGPTAFGRGIDKDAYLAGEYAAQVFDAGNLPIIYFLAGRLSGIDYTRDVIAEICQVDGVVAVKDTMWTTEGFSTTKSIIDEINPSVRIFTGNDNCVLSTMVAGAEGTLLILNCLLGSEIAAMQNAVSLNDVAEAREIDVRIRPLVNALFQKPMLKMASRAKAALELKGILPGSWTRLPVPALSTGERSELESAMREAGQLD